MNMKNRIIWGVTIVLLILLVGFFYYYRADQNNRRDVYYAEVANRTTALEKEKSRVLQQLNKTRTLYSERMSGNAFLQMICLEPRVEIFNKVYRDLSEYDMPAVLVVSVDAMPGDKGCISMEQFGILLDEKWEICLQYDASYGSIAAWYEAISARLKTLNIAVPSSVYFSAQDFKEGMESELLALGLNRFFHQNKAFAFYEPVTEENPYWNINAIPWNMSGVKAEMLTAVENGGDLLFVVGFDHEREQYNESVFSTMLHTIKEYERNGKLILSSFSEVEERRAEAANQYAAWMKEMLDNTERLEAELAEIKKQLAEAYGA